MTCTAGTAQAGPSFLVVVHTLELPGVECGLLTAMTTSITPSPSFFESGRNQRTNTYHIRNPVQNDVIFARLGDIVKMRSRKNKEAHSYDRFYPSTIRVLRPLRRLVERRWLSPLARLFPFFALFPFGIINLQNRLSPSWNIAKSWHCRSPNCCILAKSQLLLGGWKHFFLTACFTLSLVGHSSSLCSLFFSSCWER